VDNEVIYEILQEDIHDIKEFIAVFMKFLSNKENTEKVIDKK
jgi:uncharacterized protein YutE (UPF0331/DUF86 family)